jgi:hypothetical protein
LGGKNTSRRERHNNNSYTQKKVIEIGVRITGGIALENAAFKILTNVILETIKTIY